MRYTEARLAALPRSNLLHDINKNTVDFSANFDGTLTEPTSCRRPSPTCWSTARPASPSAWRPASRPTTWAKSVDALVYMLETGKSWMISTSQLMRFVKGQTSPPAA
jgi:DNA gyrase subunit A